MPPRHDPAIKDLSFSEFLQGIYALRDVERIPTKEDLASAAGVALRTIANWMSGETPPRTQADALNLARAFYLTPMQTDLLLYKINPKWVRYGTPTSTMCSLSRRVPIGTA